MMLALAFVLLAATARTAQAAAPAAEAPGAIYFDSDTGRFAAAFTGGSNRTFEVFTRLKGDSRKVELIYWPRPKQGCPNEGEAVTLATARAKDAIPEDAVRRAALRGEGDDDGTRHRFIARVGPLRINTKYCFHLSYEQSQPLSADQKDRIALALTNTIDAAVSWARADQSPHAASCTRAASLKDRALSYCELTTELTKQLGELAKLSVAAPRGSSSVRLTKAFAQLLETHPEFGRALADTLSSLIGAEASRNEYPRARGALEGTTGFPLTYDPLAGLELRDVIEAAPAKERKKYQALPAGSARSAWATMLWSDREAFTARKAWEQLKDGKQSILRDFFLLSDGQPRKSQPIGLVIEEIEMRNVVAELPSGTPTAASKRALDEAVGRYLPIAELRALPRGSTPEIITYVTALSTLQAYVDAILSAEAKLAKLRTRGDGGSLPTPFWTLLDEVESLERFTAAGRFAWEPSFTERFPLYVTADLGLAGSLIPIRERPDRFELVAYFGLNLYFAAIDKDEPVRWKPSKEGLGRNFGRRFAATAGVSLTRPRLNTDIGIGGVLRNQVLLMGAGYRVLDYLRVGAGAMMYRQDSPNPLSDKTFTRFAPYLSLSMDIDVIGTVRGWFDRARGYAAAP